MICAECTRPVDGFGHQDWRNDRVVTVCADCCSHCESRRRSDREREAISG